MLLTSAAAMTSPTRVPLPPSPLAPPLDNSFSELALPSVLIHAAAASLPRPKPEVRIPSCGTGGEERWARGGVVLGIILAACELGMRDVCMGGHRVDTVDGLIDGGGLLFLELLRLQVSSTICIPDVNSVDPVRNVEEY
ncbi:hypothetical protein Hypma_014396 [Hypsizygus marmoreus]|uniref:Uncharacterized protein n=1 Tax=Hypsizygus marmoreus TaxID=39966 RepID=A0A369JH06_HYPMA|nr:hypothetical protein Hypma_014396 [Hypsizygus marmoreus]